MEEKKEKVKRKRNTKIVRIVRPIYNQAMAVKDQNHMDICSWLSYLIKKGMEKLKEENE